MDIINLVPVDVWRVIFDFACTDTGHTGTSLSKTCKVFRVVVIPYRFRAVSLSKVDTINNFVQCFEQAHAIAVARGGGAELPRVQHLLLRFLPGLSDAPVQPHGASEEEVNVWRVAKSLWNERFVEIVTRLFALIAPRLEVLTVVQCHNIPLPFVRCSFPTLRDLTLFNDDRLFLRLPTEPTYPDDDTLPSNGCFYSSGIPPDLEGWAAAPPFPALKRLHIICGSYRKHLCWMKTLPIWAATAPRLVHLRISQATEHALAAVEAVLSARPRKFRALRTVALQAESGWLSGKFAHLAALYGGADSAHRPEVIIMGRVPFAHAEGYWKRRVILDWYESLPGRDG
ncbi:hypothetical protein C8Q70DRAFT_703642 [Cubamyces menziesii]|nr:hypothetical protein C8Q70DRAFT_703642 [Cubamyces menziesii]